MWNNHKTDLQPCEYWQNHQLSIEGVDNGCPTDLSWLIRIHIRAEPFIDIHVCIYRTCAVQPQKSAGDITDPKKPRIGRPENCGFMPWEVMYDMARDL